jgi:hypothetical protein
MARILLNTRASRVTIVNNILLLPAEVKADEQLGKVVTPSKTLVSERGKPSPYDLIMNDRPTQRLFEAKMLAWSDEHVDEPEPPETPTEKLQGPADPQPTQPGAASDDAAKAKAAAEGEAKRPGPDGTTKRAESDAPAKPSGGASKASKG